MPEKDAVRNASYIRRWQRCYYLDVR